MPFITPLILTGTNSETKLDLPYYTHSNIPAIERIKDGVSGSIPRLILLGSH